MTIPTTDILRLATSGSVDDGKSTLIGRLMYDSKSVFEDQLKEVASASSPSGEETADLALQVGAKRS